MKPLTNTGVILIIRCILFSFLKNCYVVECFAKLSYFKSYFKKNNSNIVYKLTLFILNSYISRTVSAVC